MKLVAPMQLRGAAAEQRAADFLQTKGYKILARNFSCRYGEIDLVTQHKGWLVFVEVKYRQSQQFGSAASAITYHKLQRLHRAAALYRQQARTRAQFRFEVITIEFSNGRYSLHHLQELS